MGQENSKNKYHNGYHHENLKQELILAGLKIIGENGISSLSLRKAAAMCGVSHAAPKSHFQNKEEFEKAIKNHVTEKFTEYMKKVVAQNTERKYLIRDMGRAFVRFFHDYPQSFSLIVNQKEIDIELSETQIKQSNYAPFQIFAEQASAVLQERGLPKEQLPEKILQLWALVTGLAGISVMCGFHYEGDWMEMVNRIIN